MTQIIQDKLLDKIVRTPHPRVTGGSRELSQIVDMLLKKDPRKRPTINELLEHPYIAKHVGGLLPKEVHDDEFSHTIIHSSPGSKNNKAPQVSLPGIGSGQGPPLRSYLRVKHKLSAALEHAYLQQKLYLKSNVLFPSLS